MVIRPFLAPRRPVGVCRWYLARVASLALTVLASLPDGAVQGQESVPACAGQSSVRKACCGPSSPRLATGPIEEVKPEVFYLKDKDGNLQAVPGFSFEEFVKLYRLKNQLEKPEAEPHFSLQRMLITGRPERIVPS